jgi:hypothetical protein
MFYDANQCIIQYSQQFVKQNVAVFFSTMRYGGPMADAAMIFYKFSVDLKHHISSKTVEWFTQSDIYTPPAAFNTSLAKLVSSNSKMHASLVFICGARTPDPRREDDSRPPAVS